MLLANRYQVIRELGRGGFGQTFLAQDMQMPSKRTCVVKQLKPNTPDPESWQLIQERFQREAAVLEKLGERNAQIPTLYAYICEDREFFLIQEWIEGLTLSEFIYKQKKLPEDVVRRILLTLLPVLEFIHGQGIVHRDIKPDNIIIRSLDRMPVLIDFGAVRETMGTVFNSKGHLTNSIIIGTPGFMPSEQAAGRPIASSDLYSLGLTAIYALTGKMPQEFITDPQSGEILWRNHAPHLSAEFAAILEKATRSHPRDRYSSASQMLAALQEKLPDPSIPSLQPNPLPLSSVSPFNATTMAVSSPSPLVQPLVQPAVQPTVQPTLQPLPVSGSQPRSGFNFLLMALMLCGSIGAAFLVAIALIRAPLPTAGPIAEQPEPANPLDLTSSDRDTLDATSSPDPDQNDPLPTSSDPNAQSDPSSTTQRIGQAASPPPVSETNPSPGSVASPEPERPIGEPISEMVVLVSSPDRADGRVTIYARPSIRADSPHYGLEGDRVLASEQFQAEDGDLWYFVQFPSGATGWVRSDAVRSNLPPQPGSEPSFPPEPSRVFPRPALLIGQTPGSRVNVRSAPSTRANAPHYGLVGDRITVVGQIPGQDGRTWYTVRFPSGATGWIREDFIELQ